MGMLVDADFLGHFIGGSAAWSSGFGVWLSELSGWRRVGLIRLEDSLIEELMVILDEAWNPMGAEISSDIADESGSPCAGCGIYSEHWCWCVVGG